MGFRERPVSQRAEKAGAHHDEASTQIKIPEVILRRIQRQLKAALTQLQRALGLRTLVDHEIRVFCQALKFGEWQTVDVDKGRALAGVGKKLLKDTEAMSAALRQPASGNHREQHQPEGDQHNRQDMFFDSRLQCGALIQQLGIQLVQEDGRPQYPAPGFVTTQIGDHRLRLVWLFVIRPAQLGEQAVLLAVHAPRGFQHTGHRRADSIGVVAVY